MLALDGEGDVRVFVQGGVRGKEPCLPAGIVAAALFAAGHQLGIETEGDVVDEEAVVDPGRVDDLRRSVQGRIECAAPVERKPKVAGEVVVRPDGNHGQRDLGIVHQRLYDVLDRPLAAGGDDEAAAEAQPVSHDGGDVELRGDPADFQSGVGGRLA